MNNGLNKATKVLAKLAEVAHWIGAVGCIVGLVLTFVMGPAAVVGTPGGELGDLSIYGFSIESMGTVEAPDMAAVRIFLAGGIVLFALMAMVFRNVFLILKRSENDTPFQPDNVRMVREIGWFLMALPIVGLILSVVTFAVLGPEVAEVSIDMGGILIGLVVLCLSQFFARGMALETDVDGLV